MRLDAAPGSEEQQQHILFKLVFLVNLTSTILLDLEMMVETNPIFNSLVSICLVEINGQTAVHFSVTRLHHS